MHIKLVGEGVATSSSTTTKVAKLPQHQKLFINWPERQKSQLPIAIHSRYQKTSMDKLTVGEISQINH
jgi:hypothetical protein